MKKYYLIGLIVFLAGLIGYHFIAENRAEDQLREAIEEESNNPTATFSLQYSDLDISSFRGNIELRDITLVQGNSIFRSSRILIDLSYWDFIRIYGGGMRFGLQYLTEANIRLAQPSYVARQSLFEVKFDTLSLSYTGNALDLLQNINTQMPLSKSQEVLAESGSITIAVPGTTFSRMRGHQFRYSFNLPDSSSDWETSGTHYIQIDSLTWTPSDAFQQNYSFFIRGFGYKTDAIPFSSAELQSSPTSEPNTLQLDASLESELANLTATGQLNVQKPLQNSRWSQLEVTAGNFSETFNTVLSNLERMLSVTLPQEDGQIRFQLEGTLFDTKIIQN